MPASDQPGSFVPVLSDFLFGFVKPDKEALEQHALLEVPAVRDLIDDYVERYPAQRNLSGAYQAMGAFAELWLTFRPPEPSLTDKKLWEQYLVLAAAYFAPFRRWQTTTGALRQRVTYPHNLDKLAQLLSYEEHLTEMLNEEIGASFAPDRIAALAKALSSYPNERLKDAFCRSTISYRRNKAIEALVNALEEWAEHRQRATRSEPAMAEAPAVASTAPIAVTPRDHAEQAAAEASVAASTAPEISLPPEADLSLTHADVPVPVQVIDIAEAAQSADPVASLTEWVDGRMAQIGAGAHSASVADQTRRFAQQLAGISAGIEPTPEPTTRLTRGNVLLALRRIGVSSDQPTEGGVLVDLLVRFGIFQRTENWLEFVHPSLAEFYAAEHVAGYGQHWISLRPQHHQIMKWTAVILARRSDDDRNAEFCGDLVRAMTGWFPVSLLDMADIAAEFRHAQTPSTAKLLAWLVSELQPLARIPSGWLQQALRQCGERLGVDLGVPVPSVPLETIMPANTLDVARLATDVPELLTGLGLPPTLADKREWFEDRRVQAALLDQLSKTDAKFRLQAAAWLQHSRLQSRIEMTIDVRRVWRSRWRAAVEIIADMAMDGTRDELTRILARSVLAKDERILDPVTRDVVYQPLLFTLLLALDKRLRFDEYRGEWEILSGGAECTPNP